MKIIRLTESDLRTIVRRVIQEQELSDFQPVIDCLKDQFGITLELDDIPDTCKKLFTDVMNGGTGTPGQVPDKSNGLQSCATDLFNKNLGKVSDVIFKFGIDVFQGKKSIDPVTNLNQLITCVQDKTGGLRKY